MPNWHALVYPLRPGSGPEVATLFQNAEPPALDITDETGRTLGKLLGTLAFVGNRHAVRVIEVEGPVREISAHMGRQPAAWHFQQQLQPHLDTDRDPASPTSMRDFFTNASLDCVLTRHNGSGWFTPGSAWHALVYPLRPGSGPEVATLFQNAEPPALDITDETGRTLGKLLGTLAFVGNRHAVRVIEVEGPVREISAHMGRQPAAWHFQQQLQPHLDTDRDPASPTSMRDFFTNASLDCVLTRHNGSEV